MPALLERLGTGKGRCAAARAAHRPGGLVGLVVRARLPDARRQRRRGPSKGPVPRLAELDVARLPSVLSLQSLPRRLVLDFRDVFQEGFAFDALTGDLKIAQGVASTNNLHARRAGRRADGKARLTSRARRRIRA